MSLKNCVYNLFKFNELIIKKLNNLKNKFNIDKKFVFCFKNLDDESKVIITFKLTLIDDKPLDLKNLFPSALPIHKKGSTIYTINALNKLIELTFAASTNDLATICGLY